MNSIKKYRSLLGLSQTQLAKKIGLTRASISLLEQPECHNISEPNAIKLAEVFGCSTIDIYGIDNLKYKPQNDYEKIQLIKIICDTIEDEKVKSNLIKKLRR